MNGLVVLRLIQPVASVTSNGWYVWRGEPAPPDDDFFSPIHVEHAKSHSPELVAYLALSPGIGVILAPGQEDVRHDEALLEP